jgi:hypothetical protein
MDISRIIWILRIEREKDILNHERFFSNLVGEEDPRIQGVKDSRVCNNEYRVSNKEYRIMKFFPL